MGWIVVENNELILLGAFIVKEIELAQLTWVRALECKARVTNDNEVAVRGVFYPVTNKCGDPGFSEGEGSGFGIACVRHPGHSPADSLLRGRTC